jgi:hypothetical protein
MIPLRLTNKKSVSLFVNGQRRAMCMRDDFYIPPKKVLNVKRAARPVSIRVMYDNIITAKGRYD